MSDVPERSVEIKMIAELPVNFSDFFRVANRNDGLFLVESFCSIPSGHQLNSRMMLNRSSMEKLVDLLQKMLAKADARVVEIGSSAKEPLVPEE